MPTAEWLENNPPVHSYLPKDIFALLEECEKTLGWSRAEAIRRFVIDGLNRLASCVLPALPEAYSLPQVEPTKEAEDERVSAIERVADLEAQLHAVTTQLRELADTTRVLMERMTSLEMPYQLGGTTPQGLIAQVEVSPSFPVAQAVDFQRVFGPSTVDVMPPGQPNQNLGLTPIESQGNDFLGWAQMDGAVEPQVFNDPDLLKSLPFSPEPKGIIPPAQSGQISRGDAYSHTIFSESPQFSEPSSPANPFRQPFEPGFAQPHFPQNSEVYPVPQPPSVFDAPIVGEPSPTFIDPGQLERSQPSSRPDPTHQTGEGTKKLPPGKRPDASNAAAQPPKKKETKKKPWDFWSKP